MIKCWFLKKKLKKNLNMLFGKNMFFFGEKMFQ